MTSVELFQFSYLSVEKLAPFLILDSFSSDTWFSCYFSVYTRDERVLLRRLKNSVQPLQFVWKLVEYSSAISNIFDLIWTRPDVNKLEFNVVETDDNVGNIVIHYKLELKKTFRYSCAIFIHHNVDQL